MKLMKWIVAAVACALAIHVANAQTPPKPGATPSVAAVNDTPNKSFEDLFGEASFNMWPGGPIPNPDSPIMWNPWGKTDGTTWWAPDLCTDAYALSGGANPYITLRTRTTDCRGDWVATGIGTAAWNNGGAVNGKSSGFLAAPPCYWEFGVFLPQLGSGNAANTPGLWPSISMYTDPANISKENIEYDLFEEYSGEGFTIMHTNWHNYFNNTSNGKGTTTADLSQGWHVVGLWVDTATTHWYLDGTEVFNAPTQGTTPLYAVIANALGGGWPININPMSPSNPYLMKLSYADCWTGSVASSPPGTLVQSAVTSQSTLSTTTAVTLTSEAANDLNVIEVINTSGSTGVTPTISDSQGKTWTLAAGPLITGSQGPMYIYYSNGVNAGNDTITATWSSSIQYAEVIAAEYKNNGPVFVESQTTAVNTNSSVLTVGPISASAGDLVVSSFRNNMVPNVTITYPSGYTKVATSSAGSFMASLTNVPAAGSQSATWSASGNGNNQMGIIVAFNFSSSSATVPNVVGSTQTAADAAIVAAGLTHTDSFASSTTVASGNVISETPAAGTSVAPGSSVAIVVSTGAPVQQGTVLQSSVHTQSAAGTSTFVSLSGEKAGDINVLVVGNYGGTSTAGITPTLSSLAGNVYSLVAGPLIQGNQGPIWIYMAKNIAAGTDTVTVNWSTSTNFSECFLTEVSANGNAFVEAGTTAGAASNTSLTIGPVTLSAGDVVFSVYRCSNGGTITIPSGYTQQDATSLYSQLATQSNAAGGSTSTTWSTTVSAQNELGALVAIKFGTPPPPPAITPVGVTLPSNFQLKFNEDFTSQAYVPGNNTSKIVAGLVTLPAQWTVNRHNIGGPGTTVPYPVPDKDPYSTDSGYFEVYLNTDTALFNSDSFCSGNIKSSYKSTDQGFKAQDAYWEALIKFPVETNTNGHATFWIKQPDDVAVDCEFDVGEVMSAETASVNGSFYTQSHAGGVNIIPNNLQTVPAGNGYNNMGSGWHVLGLRIFPAGSNPAATVYLDGNVQFNWTADHTEYHQPLKFQFGNGCSNISTGAPVLPTITGASQPVGIKYGRCWAQ